MIRPGSRERSFRSSLLLAGDFAIAWAALALAVEIRRRFDIPFTRELLTPARFRFDAISVLLFGATFVIGLALTGFYRTRIMRPARPILLVAITIQITLIATGTIAIARPLPRSILVAVPLFEAMLFPLWRSLQRRIRPVRPRETILVGEPHEIAAALTLLERAGDPRIRVTGSGSLSDPNIRAAVRDAEVVICVSADAAPGGRLDLLRIRGARGYLLLVTSADALLATSVLGWMGDEPLIEVTVRCGFGVQSIVKRFLDVAIALTLLALAAPLWIAVAIAIAIDDGRPLLLRQTRMGLGGVPFAMWKFRSMRDERATRVGSLLRRYRMDEIPQLLNVITGDMSLVGPRPERPEIVEEILKDVPDFDLRCLVRPGIAGLAQILAEYDSRPAVKLRYDLTYMCSWSLWLDVRLLFASVAAALSGTGV